MHPITNTKSQYYEIRSTFPKPEIHYKQNDQVCLWRMIAKEVAPLLSSYNLEETIYHPRLLYSLRNSTPLFVGYGLDYENGMINTDQECKFITTTNSESE